MNTLIDSANASSRAHGSALSMSAAGLSESLNYHLTYTLGCGDNTPSVDQLFDALSLSVRDRLVERWQHTAAARASNDGRRAHYFSLEFLMGRMLGNALSNLGISEEVAIALAEYGADFDSVVNNETDAGLGNGGLGRLAACFLDSCATLELPVTGYGIRYRYGMFRQSIHEGHQVEAPDHWLHSAFSWEMRRNQLRQRVQFGGRSERFVDARGNDRFRWVDTEDVFGVPYDVPVPGFRNGVVNSLRLWRSVATDEFSFDDFNSGSYTEAVASKNAADNISLVLYPNDVSENGKELRLRQQYFLVSVSLKDIIRTYLEGPEHVIEDFAKDNAVHLNDTHPSLAIPELMRILMDDYGLGWAKAWSIVGKTFAYTNHTLLPEAVERWSVRILGGLLPRILEIVLEINARFLARVGNQRPDDGDFLSRVSIIEEGDEQMVRMGHLAVIASFSVNGVAALHTDLLTKTLFQDFASIWPDKFNNKTNGVTHRRWLFSCNPGLSRLVDDSIGEAWVQDFEQIKNLASFADDAGFRQRWSDMRYSNKQRLSEYIEQVCGIEADPHWLFDVQVKRIHEYKRQLLNVLHAIHRYSQIKRGETADLVPRVILIGGKAAPGYAMAKSIIKLVHNVSDVIESDTDAREYLKLVFFPNYNVSAMEIICPGTDLSEQISTAGKEASGTGNMKFMMNGAVTIGTLDGANVEILEAVGADNFFQFGLTVDNMDEARRAYDPSQLVSANPELFRVIQLLQSGHFNRFEPGIFDDLLGAMLSPHDPWMTVADFQSFVEAQRAVDTAWLDQDRWLRMSILNTASSGRFSTDRTMREYNADIWKLRSDWDTGNRDQHHTVAV